ncbi:hypothetical protein Pcinc_042547 [Petrolisthes cinctipes]|uniref:Uncharacterized protein n=1 Tax=Petrolisthes cinctipes TaxID=88211 RepID=A0AAE1BH96_PETCI|nr:hypothetical protein Pcinc_042547 [Petrolisthes cinctipes]
MVVVVVVRGWKGRESNGNISRKHVGEGFRKEVREEGRKMRQWREEGRGDSGGGRERRQWREEERGDSGVRKGEETVEGGRERRQWREEGRGDSGGRKREETVEGGRGRRQWRGEGRGRTQ